MNDLQPHLYCLIGHPGLVWVLNVTNALISISYFVIAFWLYKVRMWQNQTQDWNFILGNPLKQWLMTSFGAFIFLCGCTHVMDIIVTYDVAYYLQATLLCLTAIVSLLTAATMTLFMEEGRRQLIALGHDV